MSEDAGGAQQRHVDDDSRDVLVCWHATYKREQRTREVEPAIRDEIYFGSLPS
jgi:hypothetical protein